MKKRYLSVDHEPALAGGSEFRGDPSEHTAEPTGPATDELGVLRDSIAVEPALPHRRSTLPWQTWMEERRGRCTMIGNVSVTLLAALVGGPFAIAGAMFSAGQGFGATVYVIIFAPVAEELLKQSGMTYVLEKQPYRIFSPLQFVFAAVLSGAVFASIENAVYLGQCAAAGGDVARLAAFRLPVCTTVHVVCAAVASLGLVRAWRRHLTHQRPAELADAFPYFLAAMILHGGYNTWAVLLGPR